MSASLLFIIFKMYNDCFYFLDCLSHPCPELPASVEEKITLVSSA